MLPMPPARAIQTTQGRVAAPLASSKAAPLAKVATPVAKAAPLAKVAAPVVKAAPLAKVAAPVAKAAAASVEGRASGAQLALAAAARSA